MFHRYTQVGKMRVQATFCGIVPSMFCQGNASKLEGGKCVAECIKRLYSMRSWTPELANVGNKSAPCAKTLQAKKIASSGSACLPRPRTAQNRVATTDLGIPHSFSSPSRLMSRSTRHMVGAAQMSLK